MADLVEEMFGDENPVQEAPVPVEAPATPEPEPQPVAEPVQPEPEPQQRDEQGRFAPVAALVDERVKRQEAERRAADLERQLQERNAPQAEIPDPFDDPQGYAAYQDRQFEQKLAQQKFSMSDMMARQTHGAETVEKASEWAFEKAKSDPVFAAQYMREQHPIDWIVRQHQREAMLSDIGDNMDDWFAREAEKRGYSRASAPAAAAPAAIPQSPSAPPPPRSLANAPGSGGKMDDVAIGLDASLNEVFKR